MKTKKGFISLSTIITLIVGICALLLANLAIIESRIYLISKIKNDVRNDIKDTSYPVCKWSDESTMVMPKDYLGKASNIVYVTCSDVTGLKLSKYSYEELTDKEKLKDPTYLNQIINYLITKDPSIEVSYLNVYKDNHNYKFVFGLVVEKLKTNEDEYYIDFNEKIVSNNKNLFNKKITSNKITVVPET